MSTKVATKERPIIFSADSVRAILDGRKTMTRRVVKPRPRYSGQQGVWMWKNNEHFPSSTLCMWMADRCPFGRVGDYLYVKEAAYISPRNFCQQSDATHSEGRIVSYYADTGRNEYAEDYGVRVRPAFLMPRWASRILLQITDIRVERLQQITEADAIAEGLTFRKPNFECGYDGFWGFPGWPDVEWLSSPVQAFARGWNQINGKRGYSWESNPFVFVISFRKVEPR